MSYEKEVMEKVKKAHVRHLKKLADENGIVVKAIDEVLTEKIIKNPRFMKPHILIDLPIYSLAEARLREIAIDNLIQQLRLKGMDLIPAFVAVKTRKVRK